MPFTAEQKKAVVEEYRLSDTDTGSSEVQVALLTAHINHLTPHFAAAILKFFSDRIQIHYCFSFGLNVDMWRCIPGTRQ
jgi:ribosomal protein S15